MIKVCAHWDCKIGTSTKMKRQMYQYYDFTAKAFGVEDLLLVDKDDSCTIEPPNVFETKEAAFAKVSTACIPVYISENGKLDLKDFIHPTDALYIIGPNYTGYDVPEDAYSVRIETRGLVPLWSHVALGIVLADRVNKGQ